MGDSSDEQALTTLRRLVRVGIGPAEAQRVGPASHEAYVALHAVGERVINDPAALGYLAREPGACVAQALAWVALAREQGIRAYCLDGDLLLDGVRCWGSDGLLSSVLAGGGTRDWDGHAWVAMGEFIGDLSLPFSAPRCAEPLREAIAGRLGGLPGLRRQQAWLRDGFEFRPREVLRLPEVRRAYSEHRAMSRLSEMKAAGVPERALQEWAALGDGELEVRWRRWAAAR